MNNMKTIVAIIEKASDGGYCIWAEKDGIPITGYGETEEAAKKEFRDMIEYYIEDTKELGEAIPDWYDENIQVVWKYDLSGFFLTFPFINATEFAKKIGINPALMRKYKSGIVKARPQQKDLIQKEFDKIVEQFAVVKF